MDKIEKQRLEQLVRQGIVPSAKLQVLMQALAKAKLGAALTPVERNVIFTYIDKVQEFFLGSEADFNRLKLHTQKSKYRTEETTVEVDESVRVIDGPEEEEKIRREAEAIAKRLGRQRGREKFRMLSPAVKKEKLKAGVAESTLNEVTQGVEHSEWADNVKDHYYPTPVRIIKKRTEDGKHIGSHAMVSDTKVGQYNMNTGVGTFKALKKQGVAEEVVAQNEAYKAMFELALEQYGVSNIRDLPEDKKAEFFAVVDEASKPPFDPPYKEVKKDEPHKDRYGNIIKPENIAKHLAKKGVASVKTEEVELDVEEGYGKWHGHTTWYDGNDNDSATRERPGGDDEPRQSKPQRPLLKPQKFRRSSARSTASLKREEVELTFEEMTPAEKAARLKLIAQKSEYVQSGAAAKAAKKVAKSDMKAKGAQRGMAPTKKDDIEEETELTFEEMTPAQKADRLRVIARAADRVQSGAAAKAAKKVAKSDMKAKGAQSGMAPTKKDEVDEQIQQLRQMIRENTNKAEAYKLLAKILNSTEKLGEE